MRKKIKDEVHNHFKYLIDKYSDMSESSIDDINRIIDIIILEVESYEYCPKLILTRAMYAEDVDNDNFIRGKFVLRPSIKYNLNNNDMRYCFTIINDTDFFKNFILNMVDWVYSYRFFSYLDENLNKLNSAVLKILSSCEFPYQISFTLGEGIVDISDNSIVLGISEECIENINQLGLFNSELYWRDKYIEKFITTLKECSRPYDIVKIKSDITLELGVYNRKSISKLLRKIVSRKVDYVRVGVGYVEDLSTFALIERKAISEDEVEKFNSKEVIIEDNINATIIEKKQGLSKIVTSYKLMPFDKKTNVYLDIPLIDYLKSVEVYNS